MRIGIDIGTTSVKVCLVDNGDICKELQRCHNAAIPGKTGVQNAGQIIEITCQLLEEISDSQSTISSIHTAGQMHGIVFWNGCNVAEGKMNCSNLYTWMYPSDAEEIQKQYPTTFGPVYPGYGSVTVLELSDSIKDGSMPFDCCGTIMDLFVSYLARKSEIQISRQLATSWGYCNELEWDEQLEIATDGEIAMPKIVEDSEIIGRIALERFKKLGPVELFIPIGDLQASIQSVAWNRGTDTAYIIIGTSAQLCVVVDADMDIQLEDCPKVEKLSFSQSQILLAARAMNGGNAVDTFLELVKSWFSQATGVTMDNELMVRNLLEQVDSAEIKTSVTSTPKFIPERGLVDVGASFTGLSGRTSLVEILSSICLGVVDNLFDMFPLDKLCHLGVNRLVLVGGARHPRFARQIRIRSQKYDIIVQDSLAEASAAYGAAVFG